MKAPNAQKKRSLIVLCYGGLSNRLLVLLSGFVLAEAKKRDFQMVWELNFLCNCSFNDLFINDVKMLPDISSIKEKPIIYGWYINKKNPTFNISKFSQDTLFVESNMWLIDPGKYFFYKTLNKKARNLFFALQPVEYVSDKVAQLKKLFTRPMLGVHIRRTDFYRKYPDTQVSLDVFIKEIDAFILKFPQGKIFVATDEGSQETNYYKAPYERIEERLKNIYKEKVLFSAPRSRERNSPEAIQDALVDLLLLRETDYFVGTRHSSFSRLAVFGRKVRSKTIPELTFKNKVALFFKNNVTFLSGKPSA